MVCAYLQQESSVQGGSICQETLGITVSRRENDSSGPKKARQRVMDKIDELLRTSSRELRIKGTTSTTDILVKKRSKKKKFLTRVGLEPTEFQSARVFVKIVYRKY